jgi:hypothetical protein
MGTLLRAEALAVIATQTLSLHSPLPIMTLAHIIQHNGTVHRSLESRVSVSSQLQSVIIIKAFHE